MLCLIIQPNVWLILSTVGRFKTKFCLLGLLSHFLVNKKALPRPNLSSGLKDLAVPELKAKMQFSTFKTLSCVGEMLSKAILRIFGLDLKKNMSPNGKHKPCSCGITLFLSLFFYYSFFIPLFKSYCFFQSCGFKSRLGKFFYFFLFFYHILHQKLC